MGLGRPGAGLMLTGAVAGVSGPELAGRSPGVVDHLHQGLMKLRLRDRLPLQHDPHALGLHPGHRVVMVPEEGDAHNRDAVVHGLEDAVQASVAQEGLDV